MFNMNFPIDVLWVNSQYAVVDVREQIPVSNLLNPLTWNHMPKKGCEICDRTWKI